MNDQLYKVLWKLKEGTKAQTGDYMAPSLLVLMTMLNRSVGASPKTTEYMYVHHINEKGVPEEVFAYEDETGETRFDHEDPNSLKDKKVVNIVQAQINKSAKDTESKPRVRLKVQDTARSYTTANYGRYKAYEAT